MPDGELSTREEHVEWDVIVVGTGMGGGTLGYRLAQSGRKVLFVEKGISMVPGTPGTIRSAMPEVAEPRATRSAEAYYDALARAGRSTDEIEDISGRFPKRFVPFIGSGTGGSSALYGMVCERFFVRDFTPRENFRDPGDSTVPEAWPISYDQMAPWYAEAEKLLALSIPLFSIDPIEAAMWRGGLKKDQTGIAAYEVAIALADEQLRLGHCIIVDAVNPIEAPRAAWRSLAAKYGRA